MLQEREYRLSWLPVPLEQKSLDENKYYDRLLGTLQPKDGTPETEGFLLLDSLSAHQAAVVQLGGDQGLSNVQILWLPKNTTLAFQPNDQGIIRTWKARTRNHMLNWQVHQLNLHTMGLDPKLPTIALL